MSRRICVALYNQIIALRPDWHSDDDAAGVVKVVITGSAADPQGWQPHIGTKARRDLLAKRAKDPKDALKLVIVRDMWLSQANQEGSLAGFLQPDLAPQEKVIAQVEGWILGVGGSSTQWGNLASAEVKGHA